MTKYTKHNLPDALTEEQYNNFVSDLNNLCEQHNVFLYACKNNLQAMMCVNGGITEINSISFEGVMP